DVTGTQGATTVVRLRGLPITVNSPVDKQFLQYDDANKQYVWTTVNPGVGTVTSITAVNGLSGGTITSSGSIGIAPGGVVPPMLSPGTYAIDISGHSANFTGVLGGDVTGAQGATVLAAIAGIPINNNNPPTDKQVLTY